MPAPNTIQTKPNAARQLMPTPRLQDQFTPQRERYDKDRGSRDNTPGEEVQPELQRQSQQYAMGPSAMQLEQGAPTGGDPYHRFQPSQYQQQQWQQQMMQQQMQQQQQQQQFGAPAFRGP